MVIQFKQQGETMKKLILSMAVLACLLSGCDSAETKAKKESSTSGLAHL